MENEVIVSDFDWALFISMVIQILIIIFLIYIAYRVISKYLKS